MSGWEVDPILLDSDKEELISHANDSDLSKAQLENVKERFYALRQKIWDSMEIHDSTT